MKTIEDYLQIAFDLGRIAGAAETIEAEYTRDSIYATACDLLHSVICEAADENKPDCRTADEILRSAPPDPFDMVETGEMVETPAQKQTNFSALTQSPETLAEFMTDDRGCPPGTLDKKCDPYSDCKACWLEWMNEETAVYTGK